MSKIDILHKAKEVKNDEFYTRLSDIEAEISLHPDYVKQFKGRTVLCNCDNPEWSNFYEFFKIHFKQLGLKKLIITHYNCSGLPSYKLEWNGERMGDEIINIVKTPLEGNGDFRSEECIEILKEADILVTNPPFSQQMPVKLINICLENNKKFIIIGDENMITYKSFFPLLKAGKVHIGYTKPKEFIQPDGTTKKFGNKVWYTNLDLNKNHNPLTLTKNYKGNENKYPIYDNYDAIESCKISEIPKDYLGVIGVPITYMVNHCMEQFDILGYAGGTSWNELNDIKTSKEYINAKQHNPDGSITSGGKINTGAALAYDNIPADRYYTAENSEKYLVRTYGRILIRRNHMDINEDK